jgi:hypothetical protein
MPATLIVASVKAHVHADAHERHDNAGVLADRTMPLGAHPRVGEDLRDRVLCRRRFLARVRVAEGRDVIGRVVERDELQRVGDALDQVFLRDPRHGESLPRRSRLVPRWR